MKRKVKALILTTAGTNCDNETVHAFKIAGAEASKEHVNDFISGRKELREYDILAIPGGFSFGDDIAAGKVFANKLKFRLNERSKEISRLEQTIQSQQTEIKTLKEKEVVRNKTPFWMWIVIVVEALLILVLLRVIRF